MVAMKKWIAKLNGDTLTKSDINALKRIYSHKDSTFCDNRKDKESKQEMLNRQSIVKLMEDCIYKIDGFKLSQEQNNQGKAYLLSVHQTQKGTKRKSSPFDDEETQIISNIKEFKFYGFYFVSDNWYTGIYTVSPVYQAIDYQGNWIEYTCRSWQSGTNQIEILETKFKHPDCEHLECSQ